MNNKPLAKFKGPELLEFVNEIPRIQSFLSSHFPQDEHARNIVEVLGLWHDIVPFLSVTYIPNIDEYSSELTKFESNLDKIYVVGAHSFVSTTYVGDEENLYSRVLKLYLPKIAKKALEDHNMGIGIFTMQGFEHRNKESKHAFVKYTKKRGNVCVQIMKRLWDVYSNQITWVQKKKKKKNKSITITI